MFAAICDPTTKLPLQHYKRTIPEHDRRVTSGENHDDAIVSVGAADATSPELGRDDSYGGLLDDDFENARKRKRSSLAGVQDDAHDYGNDDFG